MTDQNYSFLRNLALGLVVWVINANTLFGQFANRPINDTVTAKGIRYRVTVGGIASTGATTPFWLRSNQFGTIPFTSPTGLVSVGTTGIWGDATQNRLPYLKAGLEIVGNLNGASRLVVPEAYAALRLGYGELYIGRRKEINGLTDTLLTSGSVAWSGNAVPITQIRLGTRGFAPLKFTKGFISINAFISHGWFANTDSMQQVKLHAKSVFLRLGKPSGRVRLYGGINHFAQWGGYSPYLPTGLAQNGHIASDWSAYKNVVWPVGSVKADDKQVAGIDTQNQVGNHLGSIDVAMDVNLRRSNLYFYYQHLYEDASGVKFKNFPDGLWGTRWKNRADIKDRFFQVRQLTAEWLTTLNRSGTDPVYGGDDYFYNGQYIDGWTHGGNVIGTPIFTRTVDIPSSVRSSSNWFNRGTGAVDANKRDRTRPVNNSAVRTLHIGLYGLVLQKLPVVLFVTANRYYEWPDLVKTYDQLYSSIEITDLPITKSRGLKANVKVAFDSGQIFSNNFGVMLTLRKEGFLRAF